MGRGIPSEATLAWAWEGRGYPSTGLVDSRGRRLRVVFPGRRWGGPGPDFRGAVLALGDGTLVRGDVEVHRRASGWADHHHATDPAYDGVVLHVVAVDDGPTLDRLGRPIATLVLPRDADRRSWSETRATSGEDSDPGLVAAPCARTASSVLRVVEEAGWARFRARVARLEGDLAAVDPDQVVWRGVAEALGYSRNTAAFGRLADAVPWSEAAEAVHWRGPLGLAGLLLGTAGLLGEASLAEAHAFRAFERARNARQLLGGAAWDRRQLRSANSPAQRCRGLAELAARWAGWTPSQPAPCVGWTPAQPVGWTAGSGRPGRPGRPGTPGTHHGQRPGGPAEQVLAAVGRVAASPGPPRPPLWRLVHAPPWIGRGRAQVVVINVLVPFAAAAGCCGARELFERLPGEPTNRVLRYMVAQLSERDRASSEPPRFRGALRQQGLLHIFQRTCANRLCGACPARAANWPWPESPEDEQREDEDGC